MQNARQLYLLKEFSGKFEDIYNGRELGTFKDSLRAPIYRWFRYPAGYSYKFVYESIDLFGITPGDWIYDPFAGTGTTLVAAKQHGVNAYGVEAHSFVHWVASVKLYWSFDLDRLRKTLTELLEQLNESIPRELEAVNIDGTFPELVYKCYHPQDLRVLYLLREFVSYQVEDRHLRDLLKLALTDTLRGAAAAGTGWPYISPRKNTGDKPPKDALRVFEEQVWSMYSDLKVVLAGLPNSEAIIRNVLGDSRQRQDLSDNQVKLAITSPPYLNNYDYADRTRLETYFWGIAETWGDITEQFRDKLITAATTQVKRSDHDVETALDTVIGEIAPEVYETLQTAITELADLRLKKGGRKSYDLMVALYFNDLHKVIKETYRVLEPGGHFCLVLGDSAPYGVYLSTHDLLAEIALGVGFRNYDYHLLRKRGGKWKDNPQRHTVKLQEGIVILEK